MGKKHILIIGTGALSTLFAAKLAAIGIGITVLGTWQAALETLQKNGAQIEGEEGWPVRATNDPDNCMGSHLVLVLIKSWQTERAAYQLTKCLSDDALVISLQNGLGNDLILKNILGSNRVARGITTLGGNLIAPGIVRMAGEGSVWLERHPRIKPAANMLEKAFGNVEVVDDILPHVWSKLIINAAINPLTAICCMKNGELLVDPVARDLMGRLAREATNVGRAHGVKLPFQEPEQIVEAVAEHTRENRSSMLMDLERGVPTEVEVINGEIIRLGERYGVGVSINSLIYNCVQGKLRLTPTDLSDMIRLHQR